MGRSAFFLFFNIYYLHINVKKKSQILKKKLSSSKTGESVGNAKKLFFFLFLAQFAMKFKRKIILD